VKCKTKDVKEGMPTMLMNTLESMESLMRHVVLIEQKATPMVKCVMRLLNVQDVILSTTNVKCLINT